MLRIEILYSMQVTVDVSRSNIDAVGEAAREGSYANVLQLPVAFHIALDSLFTVAFFYPCLWSLGLMDGGDTFVGILIF